VKCSMTVAVMPEGGGLENILGHAKGFFGGSERRPQKKYSTQNVRRRDTLSFNIFPAEFYPSTWWANFNKVFFRKIGKYAALSDGHRFIGKVYNGGREIGKIASVYGKDLFYRVVYGTEHGGLEVEVETVQDSPQEFLNNPNPRSPTLNTALINNLPEEGERGTIQQYDVPLEESWYAAPFKVIPYLLASPWHKFRKKFVNLGKLYRRVSPRVQDGPIDESLIYRIATAGAGKFYDVMDDKGHVLATIKRQPGIKWATAWLKDRWDIDFYDTTTTFVKQMHGFVNYLQSEIEYRFFRRPETPIHANTVLQFA
jgi:hypothetical protein